MTIHPSGTQYDIVHGNQRAVVTEVGATLRSYSVAGHDVIAPFSEDVPSAMSMGQHLLPWPNRIRDGRYSFGGRTFQLPINEHDRHNAIHGLLRWVPWQLSELYPSAVRLRTMLFPQPGWPGILECQLLHQLDDTGLVIEISVRNLGDATCPLGYAAHPYFTFDVPIDQITVKVPFKSLLKVDDRLLPLAIVPRPADELDGRPLGSAGYDTAFCSPTLEPEGVWRVELGHADRTTVIWGEDAMGWVQLYTPPDRSSLAVEPMTCGPNAFNPGPTHDGLIVLAPGASFSSRWGISTR